MTRPDRESFSTFTDRGSGGDAASRTPSELHEDAEVGDRRARVAGRRDRIAVGDAAVDRRAAAEVVLRGQAVGVVAVEFGEVARAFGAEHPAPEHADREGVEGP